MKIKTDSATVLNWIVSVITEKKKVRTKGAAKMIIQQRLRILKELINEFELNLHATLVPSQRNKANVLTRMKKNWMKGIREYNFGMLIRV